MRPQIQEKLPLVLGAFALVFGVALFALSVSGVLWVSGNGTPASDIGMLSTAGIFVLFGLAGLWLARVRGAARQ